VSESRGNAYGDVERSVRPGGLMGCAERSEGGSGGDGWSSASTDSRFNAPPPSSGGRPAGGVVGRRGRYRSTRRFANGTASAYSLVRDTAGRDDSRGIEAELPRPSDEAGRAVSGVLDAGVVVRVALVAPAMTRGCGRGRPLSARLCIVELAGVWSGNAVGGTPKRAPLSREARIALSAPPPTPALLQIRNGGGRTRRKRKVGKHAAISFIRAATGVADPPLALTGPRPHTTIAPGSRHAGQARTAHCDPVPGGPPTLSTTPPSFHLRFADGGLPQPSKAQFEKHVPRCPPH
jgi:hypothetical protein